MKHSIITIFLALLTFFSAKAANDNYPFGGRPASMANSTVAVYDFWGLSFNQAAIARQKGPVAGVYFENRFLTKEMSLGAMGFSMPAGGGVMGVSATFFGYSQYHESKIGLTYARKLSDKISVGVQLNYLYASVAGYGNKGSIAGELGMIYELLPGLNLGAHIFNPTRTKVASYNNEQIPTIIKIGMAYSFSERVLVSIEAEKDIVENPIFKAGIEYGLTENLFVRGGIGTNPTLNSLGVGFYFGSLKFDISSSFHYLLGYSPQASFVYQF
jgi:hypothetical protein